jgi:hypothetical protein
MTSPFSHDCQFSTNPKWSTSSSSEVTPSQTCKSHGLKPSLEPPPQALHQFHTNLDGTKLTLVECVRTPLVGPYRTTYGLNSAPSSSFRIPPDAIIPDSNIRKSTLQSLVAHSLMSLSSSGDQPPHPLSSRVDTSTRVATPLKKYDIQDLNIGKSASRSLATQPLVFSSTSWNQPPCPLPSRVETSRRVVTPLKKCYSLSLPHSHLQLPHLYKTIHASLEHSGKFSVNQALSIAAGWLDWLLYGLNVDSIEFLNMVAYDSSKRPAIYKLDDVLACPIMHCRDILQEVVQEVALHHGTAPCAGSDLSPSSIKHSHLTVGAHSLGQLQHTVYQVIQYLRTSIVHLNESPMTNLPDDQKKERSDETMEPLRSVPLCRHGSNLWEVISAPDRVHQRTVLELEADQITKTAMCIQNPVAHLNKPMTGSLANQRRKPKPNSPALLASSVRLLYSIAVSHCPRPVVSQDESAALSRSDEVTEPQSNLMKGSSQAKHSVATHDAEPTSQSLKASPLLLHHTGNPSSECTAGLASEFTMRYHLSPIMVRNPKYYRDGFQDITPTGLTELEAMFKNTSQQTECCNTMQPPFGSTGYMELQNSETWLIEIPTIERMGVRAMLASSRSLKLKDYQGMGARNWVTPTGNSQINET